MNRAGTARCYALVVAAYGLTPSDTAAKVWHQLLGHLDEQVALTATVGLCQRNRFAPNPAEILTEAERLTGNPAPSPDAAVGYFLAGDWDTHPAIAAAARRVHWDRRAEPDKAAWQFRQLYAAATDDTRPDWSRGRRMHLPGAPAPARLDPGAVELGP